jgi:hypothetical protein
LNISEEELEQRLRELFADERLDLPPPSGAAPVIVAGARRRRRRRHAVQAVTGVAAAAVVVAGGLAMLRLHTEDSTAVMSADGGTLGVAPPENLTPGRTPQPSPSTPGPTGTQSMAGSVPPGAPASKPSRPPSVVQPSRLPDVATGPLLAADGFGKLKLGMSQADAAQVVTLTETTATPACTIYQAQGAGVPAPATVVISKAVGVVTVSPDGPAHTAEGVGVGSTKEQVLAAYPTAKEDPNGVVAPASESATYSFRLGESGVVQTTLASITQDCAG